MSETTTAQGGDLRAVIDILKRHHDNGLKFNLHHWFKKIQIENECKTSACAIGLYILNNPDGDLAFCNIHKDIIDPDKLELGVSAEVISKSTLKTSIEAVAHHFKIGQEIAQRLFVPNVNLMGLDNFPLYVADRIQRFLDGKLGTKTEEVTVLYPMVILEFDRDIETAEFERVIGEKGLRMIRGPEWSYEQTICGTDDYWHRFCLLRTLSKREVRLTVTYNQVLKEPLIGFVKNFHSLTKGLLSLCENGKARYYERNPDVYIPPEVDEKLGFWKKYEARLQELGIDK